jgi:hypothetical protein
MLNEPNIAKIRADHCSKRIPANRTGLLTSAGMEYKIKSKVDFFLEQAMLAKKRGRSIALLSP